MTVFESVSGGASPSPMIIARTTAAPSNEGASGDMYFSGVFLILDLLDPVDLPQKEREELRMIQYDDFHQITSSSSNR